MFRPSKYSFEASCIGRVVKALLQNLPDLSASVRSYLRSISILCTIASDIRVRQNRLLAMFRKERETGLRGMLATLDLIFFLAAVHGRSIFEKPIDSSKPEFFEAEEFAEGFSYAFYLYHKHFGLPRFSPPIDPTMAKRDAYRSYLMDASHIRAFAEMEVLIDAFDYHFAWNEDRNTAILAPPIPELERAIRIGYMQGFFQAGANALACRSSTALSLRKLAEKIFQATEGSFLELRKRPFERYRFLLPAHPKLIAALQEADLFLEEFSDFNQASQDLLTPIHDLLEFEFVPKVKFWDLVKVQRLFNFMQWYSSHLLLGMVNNRRDLVLQSTVFSLTDDDLVKLLTLVVEKEKVPEILRFLTWEPESNTLFDVQYQPIIQTKRDRFVPASILGSSNSLRNSFQLCRKRLYPDGARDPLSALLVEAFKYHTELAHSNISYLWDGQKGELDVAALFEDRLFVVECKNSLLPTGPHELRTSYEYIQTAADQLDRFKRLYHDLNFRQLLATKLGWPIGGSTQLVTCIVMANRMFIGYRIGGHAIRSSGEFAGFLAKGEIRLGNESRCFWKGDKLSGEDLNDFIEKDITYKPVWASLEEYSQRYSFGTYTVLQASYYLPMLDLAKNLGFTRTAAEIERLERGEHIEEMEINSQKS